MMEKVKRYLFYFFVFSFIGWLWEVFVYFLVQSRFVNSGTLIGPCLPIYGIIMIVFMMLANGEKKPVKLFLLYFFIIGLVEFFTSMYLEVVYHARWWDYSGFTFNIMGRTSLEVMLIFSLLGGICVNYIVPYLDKRYNTINNKYFNVILLIICLVFIIDFVYSTINPNIM